MANRELILGRLPQSGEAKAWQAVEASAGELPDDWELDLHPDLRSGSQTLEACRTLRANLLVAGLDEAPPPLLMVGAANDLACARAAAGLGVILAEERRPTLVVDANLRQPILHRLFSIDAQPGFAEALEGFGPLANPTLAAPYLWVLPAGNATRSAGELLRPASCAPVIQGLAAHFGAVVYLVPSNLAHPDVLLLGAQVPAAVLMVRRGVDSVEEMRRVRESLERSGAQMLGFTLLDRGVSGWTPRVPSSGRRRGPADH